MTTNEKQNLLDVADRHIELLRNERNMHGDTDLIHQFTAGGIDALQKYLDATGLREYKDQGEKQ